MRAGGAGSIGRLSNELELGRFVRLRAGHGAAYVGVFLAELYVVVVVVCMRVVGEYDRDLGQLDEQNLGFVCNFYEGVFDFDRLRIKYLPTSTYLLNQTNTKPKKIKKTQTLPINT